MQISAIKFALRRNGNNKSQHILVLAGIIRQSVRFIYVFTLLTNGYN